VYSYTSQTALRLRSEGMIDILPLFVGAIERTPAPTYKKFNGFGLNFPPHPSSTAPSTTVRDTMTALFRVQGLFVNPEELPERIEAIRRALSNSIWPKYRMMWADAASLAEEPQMTCVQCGATFSNSSNADGACQFHPLIKCTCDTSGCKRSRHRGRHHNDYQFSLPPPV
jgi:hypothetical protein